MLPMNSFSPLESKMISVKTLISSLQLLPGVNDGRKEWIIRGVVGVTRVRPALEFGVRTRALPHGVVPSVVNPTPTALLEQGKLDRLPLYMD